MVTGEFAASRLSEPGGSDSIVELTQRVVDGLRELAPSGWQRLSASFALTVVSESASVVADDGTRSVRCAVSDEVWDAVRRHRLLSARADDGPWWRLLVRLDGSDVWVDRDYGEEPFPGEQTFAPDAYLADLERFPRGRLPVWLAAYVGRAEPQSRSPRQAGAQILADRRDGVRAVSVAGELPDLADLWARWAVLSAAFVAVGSEAGPRIGPSVGVFESAGRSGSTVTLLPGGRAVLSGGVWDAPALDAAYNSDAEFPRLFAGAPSWVVDPVLNLRVATGLLSFCYWWEAGRWYRGESPPASECAPALPAVWTAEAVAEVVRDVLRDQPGEPAGDAVASLVSASQAHRVTREAVVNTFGAGAGADIHGALFQLAIADVVAEDVGEIPDVVALDLVRDHIRQRGLDTTGYPLSLLTADRIGVGWVVRAPVPDGEIAVDRAVFYVADDGVVERSTSSVPSAVFVAGFEHRFRLRRGGAASDRPGRAR